MVIFISHINSIKILDNYLIYLKLRSIRCLLAEGGTQFENKQKTKTAKVFKFILTIYY